MPPTKRQNAKKTQKGKGTKRKATSSSTGGKASPKKTKKQDQSSSAPPAGPLPDDSKLALLQYLLTPEAFSLAYPPIPAGKGEVDLPPEKQGPKTAPERPQHAQHSDAGNSSSSKPSEGDTPQYPHHLHLTPFQTLLASLLLSKPISHRLGLRAIKTLFSPPYSYTTPSALEAAGTEGRRAALWDARTQHKEKTAEQLGWVVDGVGEMCEDTEEDRESLGVVKQEAERLAKEEQGDSIAKRKAARMGITASLVEGIKGVGPGVVSIFLRRIQNQWECVFPFADERTLRYAEELGLIEVPEELAGEDHDQDEDKKEEGLFRGADELFGLLMESRKEGGEAKDGLDDEKDAFVRLLDVVVGLGLEKKIGEAREGVEMTSG